MPIFVSNLNQCFSVIVGSCFASDEAIRQCEMSACELKCYDEAETGLPIMAPSPKKSLDLKGFGFIFLVFNCF